MTAHPLTTLRIEAAPASRLEFEPFELYWYHVPRIGDNVALDNGKMLIHGEVLNIVWSADHVVVELI